MQIQSALDAEIAGMGSYVPEERLTNEDLEQMVETSDEWISKRTGIKERRVRDEDEATSDLAVNASREALADAGLEPSELDAIIVATCTPDHLFPATACLLQSALGAEHAMAFDLEAACSGFVYAFAQAAMMTNSGAADNVLFVGSESLTAFTDYDDRGSCILFGDGAGAAVLRPSTRDGSEVLHAELGADGSDPSLLRIMAGGSRKPASHDTVDAGEHYMELKGREVFRQAVNKLGELMRNTAEATGVELDDVNLIVPHQSNLRIIQSACERVDISPDKAYMNIDRYGNTSSASIPLALDEARRNGEVDRGDLVLLLAFGAGLTWASLLFRY